MLRQLKAVILRKCNLDSKHARRDVIKHSTTKKSSERTLVDFFNLKYDVKRKGDRSLRKNGRFLLCLDQADSLLEHDEVKFEKFLSHMTRQCQHLKIVVAAAINMKLRAE